jgi:hypothetical protein
MNIRDELDYLDLKRKYKKIITEHNSCKAIIAELEKTVEALKLDLASKEKELAKKQTSSTARGRSKKSSSSSKTKDE